MKRGRIMSIGKIKTEKCLPINSLLKDIEKNGVSKGIGKPEFLKYKKAWSRRINEADRLVYDVIDNKLCVYSCRGHYED